MGLILLMIGLIGWMVSALGGHLAPAHWALLYVGIALVTGIAFWTITGSTGQVTLNVAQVALRLGGGAAIGAAFMLIAYSLVATNDPYVIVPLRRRRPPAAASSRSGTLTEPASTRRT